MWTRGHVSNITYTETGLALSIDEFKTVQDCLDNFMSDETYHEYICKGNHKELFKELGCDAYECGSCKTYAIAIKRKSIVKLPKYLMLQLKVFGYNHKIRNVSSRFKCCFNFFKLQF